MEPLRELEAAYADGAARPRVRGGVPQRCCATTSAVPTPLGLAARLSERLGCRVFLKREDLCHTGAHKINNALGQALLVQRMGKTRVVAETGAGQHGVATATVCALLGPRVRRLHGHRGHGAPGAERAAHAAPRRRGARRRLGHAHAQGRDQRGDARLGHERAHDPLPARLGARRAPVPGDGARLPGGDRPARRARRSSRRTGALPDLLVACVGGGSNAIGLFFAFLEDEAVRMVGVEAGGRSAATPGEHARPASSARGAARGVGRSACCRARARTCCRTTPATCCPRTRSPPGSTTRRSAPSTRSSTTRAGSSTPRSRDEEALAAFHLPGRDRGHPAGARVGARGGLAPARGARRSRAGTVLVNLSGRGDKDLGIVIGDAARTPRPAAAGVPPDAPRAARRRRRHEAAERPGQQPVRADRRLLARRARRRSASAWRARPPPATTARSSARATPTPRRSSASATSSGAARGRARTSATWCARACT